jgi:hypothetical protein
MLDFLRYLLLASTLLDNCGAIHLINSKDLLELGSFVKALFNKCVKAGSSSLLILGRGIKVIKKAINGAASPNIKDLRLFNVIIIEGFYINIVFKACLNKIRV